MKSLQDEIKQLKQENTELRQMLNEALATIKEQKISGCFHSLEGAQAFYKVRTYIFSLANKAFLIWVALHSTFSGQLIVPAYTTPVQL
jgi:hypothetical protein